jgi:glucokinase
MPDPNNKAEYVVGVDLGGTKILSGVFASGLNCVAKAKITTKSQRGAKAVIERIARCVREAVDEADLTLKDVSAVGVGAPGGVDSDTGRVIFAPNLVWEDLPLKRELEEHLKLPVFVGNDCSLSILGIYITELKSKPRNVVGLFIGTGIGGGLIFDGQLYTGSHHTAGEVGHIVLVPDGPKCSCGNKGCFEAVASRKAIFQRIESEVKNGQKTVLTEMLGEDLHDLRSGDLRKAIRRGDKFVARVVEEAAEYIGLATANLINLLDPDIVVLGGGVIEALADEMLSAILKVAQEHVIPGTFKQSVVMASQLGDDAGITGAAVLARQKTKKD